MTIGWEAALFVVAAISFGLSMSVFILMARGEWRWPRR